MKQKKWVLVTGGAQRIGAYINQQLAKQNYNIVLHYHQSENAALMLKAELESLGAKVILWQADLNSPESLVQKTQSLLEEVPTIDLLINNASIFEQGYLLETSLAQIQSHLNVHLTSPWLLIQAIAKQNISSQVINILDANLSHNYTSKSAYFITKKSLATLTELAAIECSPKIRVNAIAPGYVLEAIDAQHSEINASDVNLLEKKVPLIDIYSAIELLINNHSLTGQTINIDGGSHLKCPPYMLKN
jgi:NAD(P)-dependent dehydrogenase (short-subunit alcohol dehydrogenase family)